MLQRIVAVCSVHFRRFDFELGLAVSLLAYTWSTWIIVLFTGCLFCRMDISYLCCCIPLTICMLLHITATPCIVCVLLTVNIILYSYDWKCQIPIHSSLLIYIISIQDLSISIFMIASFASVIVLMFQVPILLSFITFSIRRSIIATTSAELRRWFDPLASS